MYPYSVLHQPRFTEPCQLPDTLVGSYPTVSPLPIVLRTGGLLSVALALDHSRRRSRERRR